MGLFLLDAVRGPQHRHRGRRCHDAARAMLCGISRRGNGSRSTERGRGRVRNIPRRGLKLIAAAHGALALLLLSTVGFTTPAQAGSDPATPLTAEIQAAHFAEPLVRTAPTTTAEDQGLVLALAAYETRTAPDDVGRLTAFLSTYPHSGWAPALLTNLGIIYLHYGYFSRALDAWQRAWQEGSNALDPQAKRLVDGAVGRLAALDANLGHIDQLAVLLKEIAHRPISGSATEAVQTAAETLRLVGNKDAHLFNCGPEALRALLRALGVTGSQVDSLQFYHPGPNGTNLAEVAQLADKAKLQYRLVFRQPGQPVPLRAIVHWKVGHFAAIVGQTNGRYHVEDPVFPGQQLWVTPAALDQEASGYFLVPAQVATASGWRAIPATEAASVWGKGGTTGPQPGAPGPQDPPADPPPGCPTGMCGYNIGESTVSLTLVDNPVGYTPPIGPSAKVQITYNQREDSQPANFSFFNISQKWTLNWLSYVTDDPNSPGASVTRYLSGGGSYSYTGYNSSTGQFAAQNNDGSVLVLSSASPITYKRQLANGSVEVYAQSNGAPMGTRLIFLSQIIDPQGNTLTLNYDNQLRLTSLTDAVGRLTTLTYGLPSEPLLVTQITDPFGRSASLTYDASERLSSITDVLGLTSSFTYDAYSLVNSMTTPYGTTTFAYTAPGTSGPPLYLQVTDPLGFNEREEWLEPAPPSVPPTDPAVPQGMPLPPKNDYFQFRDSFHWDKNAYVVAGCTPTGGCDFSKARDRHFNHLSSNINDKSTSIESVKYPLEYRIWFQYPGQTDPPIFSGTSEKPVAIGRVLDDGTTQLSKFSYDTGNYFELTQTTDPIGRTTSFTYAPNAVDLTAITQTVSGGTQATIAQFAYTGTNCTVPHRVCSYIDAASQTTTYTYNAAGQLASVTNPLNQTTSYQYDPQGNLTTIINADNLTAASFTYDSDDRIRTYTDSEGWAVTYDYDAADRITRITYPDGTADVYTYDKLDLSSYQDRLFRMWTYAHDANRRLTAITDPLGQQTLYGYDNDGRLTSFTDPNTNKTQWAYDVEGRLTSKTYPDLSTLAYTYENTTSRLKSVFDALGQTKQYGYAQDNRLAGITYLNPVNPTPNVAFAYDPYFPRRTSMTDGTGTTQYTYVPVGTLGALKLQQEQSPLASSAIAYAYDALGRLASRTVAGAGAESFGYDAIGRLTSHSSDLGAFALSYLGETGQIASRNLPSPSTLATNWGYLPNAGDRRLATINNTGLAVGQFSNFTFTTTPENFISAITESSDVATVYPPTLTQTASYNNLNQLTNLSGQALSWDADGNLLSDGTRSYSWDAENRLAGITYPGTPGKATAFAYDGLGRRTAIASTPAGGGTVTTSYLWCGARLCQARNATNATIREYYAEGEFVPGTPATPLYYGPDQLGTARRVFASTSSAPAYAYDPYGQSLQATAPLTDFTYAGMFANADSGLYLTQYRAYDPASGRWLSRDRTGVGRVPWQAGGRQLRRWPSVLRVVTAQYLYQYVWDNPVRYFDRSGADPAGGYTPAPSPPGSGCDDAMPVPAASGPPPNIDLGPDDPSPQVDYGPSPNDDSGASQPQILRGTDGGGGGPDSGSIQNAGFISDTIRCIGLCLGLVVGQPGDNSAAHTAIGTRPPQYRTTPVPPASGTPSLVIEPPEP